MSHAIDTDAMMRSLDSALVEHQRAESPRRATGGRRAVAPGLAPPPPPSSLASLAGIPPIARGARARARARPAWLDDAENVEDLGSLLEGLDAPGGAAAPPRAPSNADALTDELDGALAMLDRTLAARDAGAAARGAPPAALDGGAIDMAAALAMNCSLEREDRDAMLRAHRLLSESGVSIGVWDIAHAQQRAGAPPPPSGNTEPELKLLGAWRDQLWQR